MSFSQFIKSFNSDNSKGYQFEKFVKWFLKNDPEWSTQVDEVWLWDEYPDRWGPDCGIDLVFRHKNGEVWAVQAKCYDAKYSISKKDVDTFLSESNRQGVDKRLLVASTDQVGRNAKQVCRAQEKPVTLYLYTDFEKAAIDYPSSISELNSAKRKELPQPRPHQTKAIKDVVKGFKTDDRGQMIMACGTGKTFTTLWLKESLKAETTLVLLPSLSLLSQTLREWTSAASEPFEALCVCSDETVGKQSNDELISSVQDVAFPTTSDPQEIMAFLGRDVSKVVFSTYHSSPAIAEAQSDNSVQAFDLVVADEAHRCTGEAGKAFTTVLDGNLIKAKKRLFTTATPRTYSTNIKKKSSEMGVDIADMSDESLFGKVFHNLTFGQAIDENLLTDYRVVIIGVDEPMISNWIANRELVRTEDGETTDAKTLASQIGLIKAIKDYDLKRMISFHSRVKGAEWFAEDLHNAIDFVSDEHRPEGEIYTDFVSGKMSSYDRGLKLSQLKELSRAERGLLTNARCLSEGVDVPSLDGVAFIDPRSSQVDIVQAVGRAIRKSDSKTIGTIVLPVFIEDTDNAEESLQSSNFKPIWGVLNALKSHDETLSLELDQLRTNLGRQGGVGSVGSLPEKLVFDLPKTINNEFSDALRTITVDKTTTAWEFWYGLLLNFYEENKHIDLLRTYKTPNGYNLGHWVGTQRINYKKGLLSQEKITKLNDLGVVWNVNEKQWDNGISALKEFIKNNKTASVPARYITKDGFKLGAWLGKRRRQKKANQLSVDRIDILNKLGINWSELDKWWDEGFEFYKEYVERNDTTLVRNDYITESGYNLGNWVANQRLRKKENKISKERLEKLNAINFIWDNKTYNWEVGFSHFMDYVESNDRVVPQKYITKDGFKLGNWVNKQKSDYRLGKLTESRFKKLHDVGFIWNAEEYTWNQYYNSIKKYKKRNDKFPSIRYKDENGRNIGKWMGHQRNQRNKNILSIERIRKLDELGFVWNPLEYQWEENLEYLKEYISKNGDSLVPNRYKTDDGFGLGSWTANQRRNKDKLMKEQIQKLDELGFVWNVRK